jgi:ABC-type glycerol-3-phosphate transport system substrate-binding protein
MKKFATWLVGSVTTLWFVSMAAVGAADLTVWWNKGFYPEEDEAIHRLVVQFEQETKTSVELNLFPQQELVMKLLASLATGQPPEAVFAYSYGGHESRWAAEGSLLDLSDIVGPRKGQYNPAAGYGAHPSLEEHLEPGRHRP